MEVLCLLLLVGLPTFLLGVFIWAVVKHFITAEIPSSLQHPVKFRCMHCLMLFIMALGNQKLRICSLPSFIIFMHDLVPIRKDPTLVVTNMHLGTIPVRLFQPKAMSSKLRRGIIFYHGGAAAFGSLDIYHNLCSFLVQETDSVLLSVGYCKLPKHHHPAALNDCLSATILFLKALETYGVDPSQVVLCGDSFGGWVVASISQTLVSTTSLPQIRAQVLIYPVLQVINFLLPSLQQNKNIPLLSKDLLIIFVCNYLSIDLSWGDYMLTGAVIPLDKWKKYRKWLSSDNIPRRLWSQDTQPEFLGHFNEAAYLETKHIFNPEISLIIADDKTIAQLPEAFLVSCEYDIVRDDTLLYKKRLEDQGVPVTWHHVMDGFHGCVLLFDRKFLSFPCSIKVVNTVVSCIKSI
uniref:AADACL4 family member 4 n=1 Tax=Mus spicilegus TaxID=10103 RepID=A0A8C6IBJ0_MUSSI